MEPLAAPNIQLSLASVSPVFDLFAELPNYSRHPPLRNLAEGGILEGVGEEGGGGGVHAGGLAAVGFGPHGVEVDKPTLEDRPGHRFERLIHPPVQLDLVVQRAEDVGDGLLLP